jgi:hypothetical protein
MRAKSRHAVKRDGTIARRSGLKIEVFAFSLLVSARQFNRVFPGKLRKFVI